MVAGPLPTRGAFMTSIAELYAFQEIDLELKAAKDELEAVQSELGETEALVAARTTARSNKEWAEADRIRDELVAEGVTIIDTPDGPRWRRE